ncbi:MAG: hypothetical protein H6581_24220 [Bacteroidia bacterium]|nr:hypothetical protein [Bacteroidia bacterium]
MKHISILFFALLIFAGGLQAQKLDIESVYTPSTLRKKSTLKNVAYDPKTGETVLTYMENNLFTLYFRDYVFDENLKFKEEREDKFDFGEKLDWEHDAGVMALRARYPWFNYRGESYSVPFIDVWRTLDGKIRVRNAVVTYNYSWLFGTYIPTVEYQGSVKLGGENDEKIYPYERAINAATGDLFLVVGIKASKDDKKGNAFQHCRKFQIVKITPQMEVTYLDEIDFEFNQGINYSAVVTPNNEPVNMIDDMYDISCGKWYLMLSPIKTMIGAKYATKDPSNHTLLIINSDGSLSKQIPFKAPTSGFVVEDIVAANGGDDAYIYGPAKEDAFVNMLQPTNSPLTYREEVKDIKYKDFQILKIHQEKVEYIQSTNLDDFEAKAVTPPSQKKTPVYQGKNTAKSRAQITPDGQLFITAQQYTTKKVPDPEDTNPADGVDMIKVVDAYKDLILFHFAADGKLKAQYGVRRDFNNRHAKENVTPQDLFLSPDGKTLYWVYDEIQGFREGFSFNVSTLGGLANTKSVLSKSKLLTFPAVSRIDLASTQMTDFVNLGQNAEGKQEFYTHPAIGAQLSGDRNFITFVGEDKQGKRLWLGRMPLK